MYTGPVAWSELYVNWYAFEVVLIAPSSSFDAEGYITLIPLDYSTYGNATGDTMNWDFIHEQENRKMWSNYQLKITDIKTGMDGNPWGIPIGHVRARVHISGCSAGDKVLIGGQTKGKSALVNYTGTNLLHAQNAQIGIGGESILMKTLKPHIPSPRFMADYDFWGCDSWHVV